MAILNSSDIMYVDSAASLPVQAMLNQLAIDNTSGNTYKFNGTNWIPSARDTVKISSVSINAMTTGSTLIYTLENTPSTLNFVPVDVILTMVSQTGTIVTQPVITVGTNALTYNNIAVGSALASILGTLGVGTGAPTKASSSPLIPGGTLIYANVTSSAIGPSALTYNIDLVGYYKGKI